MFELFSVFGRWCKPGIVGTRFNTIPRPVAFTNKQPMACDTQLAFEEIILGEVCGECSG